MSAEGAVSLSTFYCYGNNTATQGSAKPEQAGISHSRHLQGSYLLLAGCRQR